MCNKYHSMSTIDQTKNRINFCLSACRLHVKQNYAVNSHGDNIVCAWWIQSIRFFQTNQINWAKQTQRGNQICTVDQRKPNVYIKKINAKFTEEEEKIDYECGLAYLKEEFLISHKSGVWRLYLLGVGRCRVFSFLSCFSKYAVSFQLVYKFQSIDSAIFRLKRTESTYLCLSLFSLLLYVFVNHVSIVFIKSTDRVDCPLKSVLKTSFRRSVWTERLKEEKKENRIKTKAKNKWTSTWMTKMWQYNMERKSMNSCASHK